MRKATLFLCLLSAVSLAHPPLFQKLSYAEAQARAAAEHKRLLVDATASWCGPCKSMDETTWLDPTLARACGNMIVIQIDVDEQQDLASELQIRAVPTMMLFEGTREVDRTVGSRTAAGMMDWFQLIAQGQRESDRLGEQAKTGDLDAHQAWAVALLREGKIEQGIREYVWLWDHMAERDPNLSAVRLRPFAIEIKYVILAHPTARAPFAQRLAAAPPGSPDWMALSLSVDDGQTVVDRALKVTGTPAVAELKPEEFRVFYQLSKRGLWKEAGLFLVDPEATARAEIGREEKELARVKPEQRADLKLDTNKRLASLYRACQAAERPEAAAGIKALLLQRDPTYSL